MKLLLISVNRERDPYPVFPIGLAYLIPSLSSAGHQLSVLDLCFTQNPTESVSSVLGSFAPDAVLISLRNLDNVTWPGSHTYYEGATEIVSLCKGKATTIIGGSGFSLMPLELLSTIGADYGVIGEGEEILPRLLACIESGEDASKLNGVLIAGQTSFLPPLHVTAIGAPDRSLFDLARYHRDGGMANLQTKRGCPFNCIYCTYPLLEGRRTRLRPISDIIDEIRYLVDVYGVDYIYFVDDIFNFPTDFAEQLCSAMINEKLPVNWTAFISPGFISQQLLQLMVKAGCDAVEFGSESGSDTMLKNLGKSFSAEIILNSSQLCHDSGIDFAHYILFGGPGETNKTILETFDLMDLVQPTAVIAMTGIRIYPGTPLEKIAINDGVIAEGVSMLDPVFYISPEIKETMSNLVTTEALKRRTWIVPGLDINTSPAMLNALRMFKVNGPLWKLMKRLGRSRIKPLGN